MSYHHSHTVYHVLLHLRSTLSPGDFFHVLDDSVSPNLTPAVKLLQVYARQGDRQLLRDFYYQDDRRTENACLEMEEAGSTMVRRQAVGMTFADARIHISVLNIIATRPKRSASTRTGHSRQRSVVLIPFERVLTEDGRRCQQAINIADDLRKGNRVQTSIHRSQRKRFHLDSPD